MHEIIIFETSVFVLTQNSIFSANFLPIGSSTQEKVTRLSEAMVFFIASKSRAAFRTLTDTGSQNSGAEDHSLESSSKEEETKG